MVQSSASYPDTVSEIDSLNLETLASSIVKPLRLTCSPVHMECRLVQCINIPRATTTLVVGEVLQYHIHPDVQQQEGSGIVDAEALQAIGRMGGSLYCRNPEYYSLHPDALDS